MGDMYTNDVLFDASQSGDDRIVIREKFVFHIARSIVANYVIYQISGYA